MYLVKKIMYAVKTSKQEKNHLRIGDFIFSLGKELGGLRSESEGRGMRESIHAPNSQKLLLLVQWFPPIPEGYLCIHESG